MLPIPPFEGNQKQPLNNPVGDDPPTIAVDDGTTEVPALPRSAATGGPWITRGGIEGTFGRVGCTSFTYVSTTHAMNIVFNLGILGDEKTHKYQLYRAIL